MMLDTNIQGCLPTTASIVWLLVVATAVGLLWRTATRPWTRTAKMNEPPVSLSIEPVADFDWSATPKPQLRPFKSQYNLSMSIFRSTISRLVEIDQTYLERIKHRRELLRKHDASMVACNDAAKEAVLELYRWIFATYLPRRFPTMFVSDALSGFVRNQVTNELIDANEQDPLVALRTLGSHVDNDFLILLPSSTTADGQPIYHLEAFITCFPSGFSTRAKLSLPLAAIHKPVPGYAAKLERSMDRYFAKIAVGTVVERANWTVTMHDKLYTESGNHLYKEQAEGTDEQKEAFAKYLQARRDEVDVAQCRFRVERQTLHRLPNTQALVFGFKTYQYTLDEVKTTGDGPALAEAIEGMGKGNVPDMMFYKSCVIWGEKVINYLRSDT